MKTFNYPSWSPDGNRLAFEGGRPVFEDAPGPITEEVGVYVVDAAGSGLTKLADGTEPVWSPDGTKIAFVRDQDLFVVDEDAGQVTQLTQTGDAVDPAWQPVLVSEVALSPPPRVSPHVTATIPVGSFPRDIARARARSGSA